MFKPDSEKRFAAFSDEFASSQNFGFQTCCVEKLSFCAHSHSTHLETAKHVFESEDDTAVTQRGLLGKYLSVCIEIEARDNEEIPA